MENLTKINPNIHKKKNNTSPFISKVYIKTRYKEILILKCYGLGFRSRRQPELLIYMFGSRLYH